MASRANERGISTEARLRILDQAIHKFQSAGDRLGELRAMEDINRIAWPVDPARFIRNKEREIDIFTEQAQHRAALQSRMELAVAFHFTGQAAQAQDILRDVIAAYRREGRILEVANAQWRLAQIVLELGDFEYCVALLEEAMETLARVGRPVLRERVRSVLGQVYGLMSAESSDAARRGAAIAEASLSVVAREDQTDRDSHIWRDFEFSAAVDAGLMNQTLGNAQRAVLFARLAGQIASTGTMRDSFRLGILRYHLRDPAGAIQYLSPNLALEAGALTQYQNPLRLRYLGLSHAAAGNRADGVEFLRQSVDAFETLRRAVTSFEQRSTIVRLYDQAYSDLIENLFDLNRPGDILHYSTQAKARFLREMMANPASTVILHDSGRPEVERQLAMLRREDVISTGSLLRGISVQSSAGSTTQTSGAEARIQERNLSERLRAIDRRISETSAGLTELSSVGESDLRDIVQTTLDGKLSVVDYYFSENSLFISIISRGQIKVLRRDVARSQVEQLVQTFTEQAITKAMAGDFEGRYGQALRVLSEILWWPVDGDIPPNSHVVFVPHRSLHFLPFSALMDRRSQFLIQKASVSYAPSLRIVHGLLREDRRTASADHGSVLAIGAPLVEGYSPLPGAEQEAKQIARIFKQSTLYVGADAKKQRVVTELQKHAAALISAHADLDEKQPLESGLRFTPDAGNDGRLTAREIFLLRNLPETVVLSACDTGAVRGVRGERLASGDEFMSIGRAFLAGGSRNVVATFWPVFDNGSVDIMIELFQGLMTGKHPAEALRAAQLRMLERDALIPASERSAQTIKTSHPIVWSSHFVLGIGR